VWPGSIVVPWRAHFAPMYVLTVTRHQARKGCAPQCRTRVRTAASHDDGLAAVLGVDQSHSGAQGDHAQVARGPQHAPVHAQSGCAQQFRGARGRAGAGWVHEALRPRLRANAGLRGAAAVQGGVSYHSVPCKHGGLTSCAQRRPQRGAALSRQAPRPCPRAAPPRSRTPRAPTRCRPGLLPREIAYPAVVHLASAVACRVPWFAPGDMSGSPAGTCGRRCLRPPDRFAALAHPARANATVSRVCRCTRMCTWSTIVIRVRRGAAERPMADAAARRRTPVCRRCKTRGRSAAP
jgi:hypothetical protein